MRERRLQHLIGRSALEVLQALADLIAQATESIDDNVARRAALDVLQQRCGAAGTFEELEDVLGRNLSIEQLAGILEDYLERYIFLKMLNIIKERIDRGTTTVDDAKRVEDDLRAFIKANVHFELDRIDIDAMDWNSPEASQLLGRLIRDAYEQLGEDN